MNYIYAVICHKLTEPLIFTIHTLLKSPLSIIILHIDNKTPNNEVIRIKKKLGDHPNLLYVPEKKRIDVRWGGVSQIEVMLLLLRLAQRYNYKYFSLISGDDIPLSSNKSRESFLNIAYSNRIEFIGYNPVHNAQQRLAIKYPSYFYNKDHSIMGKLCRKIFILYAKYFRTLDISHLPTLYKGSTWFTLTHEAVDYILDYVEKNPKYLNSFKYSLCGDEVFFQTIIFNSLFRYKVYNIENNIPDCERGMRYIDWVSGPSFPRELDNSDFIKMKQSGMLFARKVKSNIDQKEFEFFLL
ncbi:beta-1,6-N-acetylglucosaminyltransferase [Acinetobacter sp. YH12236]|uniref:beta-1,6-N-acetylglucosaminyltransferase n=1 Tax=Acinetobacter sp. YH12236 TaxID=2601163 RepID=UPI0015D26A10|nr:beta-1,6-N-acetylglucosaminyltransferase [Acinetobacter sp. YH12236]